MAPDKASIISLTYGRYEMAKKVFNHNLSMAGMPYELLICDQGPEGEPGPASYEFFEYLKSLNPSYLRMNHYNEGVSRSLNQLMLRCKTDYICFMPPDIVLPDNWLIKLVEHASDIPMSGIVGFEGQDLILPKHHVVGHSGREYAINCERELVLEGCQVYGATLVTRELLEGIGYYCEDYHPYSFEDADLCFRAHIGRFLCYYIPELKSEHIGLDHGAETDYKNNKIKSYFSNAGVHRWRINNYWRIGLYVPPPMLRDPLI